MPKVLADCACQGDLAWNLPRAMRGKITVPGAAGMSDTDGFIEEVNEEVRRDRLYQMLRRYGWIAVLAILLIVGGASYSEYRKAQDRAEAEALGDAMLAALSINESTERADALAAIAPGSPASAAVLRLLTAAQQSDAGDTTAAVATLDPDVAAKPALVRTAAMARPPGR